MKEEDLITLIKGDITASGALPVSLSDDEIKRIINVEKNYMHRQWREAVEVKWTIMRPEVFRTPDFRASRTIQLPDCVMGINELREIKDGSRLFGLNDPDLTFERVFASDLFLSPFSSDVIAGRTVSYSWYDLARSYTLTLIQFKFNINTHRVQIIGRDPQQPVLIQAYVAIEDSALYDDYLFQQWCIAKCRLQVGRILGTFSYSLVGGGTINSENYMSQASQMLDSLKEQIKGDDAADWCVMIC